MDWITATTVTLTLLTGEASVLICRKNTTQIDVHHFCSFTLKLRMFLLNYYVLKISGEIIHVKSG
uniref:Uncharacterized protein n=1 Tax=Anguilla anguilla TaxID=7936 RepID=A0A0E9VS57_ANGAN